MSDLQPRTGPQGTSHEISAQYRNVNHAAQQSVAYAVVDQAWTVKAEPCQRVIGQRRGMPILVKVGNWFVPDACLVQTFAPCEVYQGAVGPARHVVRRHIEWRVRRDGQEAVLGWDGDHQCSTGFQRLDAGVKELLGMLDVLEYLERAHAIVASAFSGMDFDRLLPDIEPGCARLLYGFVVELETAVADRFRQPGAECAFSAADFQERAALRDQRRRISVFGLVVLVVPFLRLQQFVELAVAYAGWIEVAQRAMVAAAQGDTAAREVGADVDAFLAIAANQIRPIH